MSFYTLSTILKHRVSRDKKNLHETVNKLCVSSTWTIREDNARSPCVNGACGWRKVNVWFSSRSTHLKWNILLLNSVYSLLRSYFYLLHSLNLYTDIHQIPLTTIKGRSRWVRLSSTLNFKKLDFPLHKPLNLLKNLLPMVRQFQVLTIQICVVGLEIGKNFALFFGSFGSALQLRVTSSIFSLQFAPNQEFLNTSLRVHSAISALKSHFSNVFAIVKLKLWTAFFLLLAN